MTIAINSKHVTIGLHVLIWSALLIVPYLLAPPESHYSHVLDVPGNFFTLSNILHIGLFYFNAFFLYSKFLTRRRWWIYVLCIGILIVGLFNLKWFVLKTFYPTLAREQYAFAMTFFPVVFFLVVSTVYRLVVDKINNERDQLAMELKFLRSQVSPHFLFNVLNNLVSMARHKSDLLEPSLMRLSGLMRYMLYESDEKRVPLASEIEYLQSYINLQELRFDEDVTVRKEIDVKNSSCTIEPMLLIPFVENAFKHGVILVDDPCIAIALTIDGNTLHFRIENKFEAQQSKDSDSGIGIANVKARLHLLYPGQHSLRIDRENNMFNVNLLIKLK